MGQETSKNFPAALLRKTFLMLDAIGPEIAKKLIEIDENLSFSLVVFDTDHPTLFNSTTDAPLKNAVVALRAAAAGYDYQLGQEKRKRESDEKSIAKN